MDTILIKISTETDHTTVYRWRYHAEGNHEDMGGSTQPYNTIEACMDGMARVTGCAYDTTDINAALTSIDIPIMLREAGDLHLVIETT